MRLKVPASNRRGEWPVMLKYVSKFTMDILPSVVATIIGAYIVNHYIVAKPGAYGPGYAPVTAAVSAEPKAEVKAGVKNDAKAGGTSGDVASLPEPGVKAKGISEKAMLEKTAAEKPREKSSDKPAETASVPAETHRHQPAPRERAVARSVPAPVQPAVAPVIAAPNTDPAIQ